MLLIKEIAVVKMFRYAFFPVLMKQGSGKLTSSLPYNILYLHKFCRRLPTQDNENVLVPSSFNSFTGMDITRHSTT